MAWHRRARSLTLRVEWRLPQVTCWWATWWWTFSMVIYRTTWKAWRRINAGQVASVRRTAECINGTWADDSTRRWRRAGELKTADVGDCDAYDFVFVCSNSEEKRAAKGKERRRKRHLFRLARNLLPHIFFSRATHAPLAALRATPPLHAYHCACISRRRRRWRTCDPAYPLCELLLS